MKESVVRTGRKGPSDESVKIRRRPVDDRTMRHLREVELPSVIDEVLAEPEFKGQRTALNLKPQDLRRRILNPREVDKLLSATNAEISELRHVQRRLGDSEPADLDEAHRVEYGALWEVLALLAQAAFTLCAALLWRAILSGEATALWKLVLFVVVLLGLVVITCCSVVAIVKINNRRPRWEARKVGSAGDLLEHPVSYVLVRLMFVAVAASFIILAWSWLSAEFTILGAILVDFLLIVGVIFQLLAAAAGRTPDERSASERAEAASRRRLREEEAKALGAWRAAARRTVKPVIGQLISTLTTPSYDVNLRIRDDSSLDSMANIDVIVDTTATEQFKRTLRRLRSGAIGVAGPRGAGKTTLLQAYHEGRFLPAGREHLLIRADAPIVYESRDFALHLFAVSCRAVINHRRNFADPG